MTEVEKIARGLTGLTATKPDVFLDDLQRKHGITYADAIEVSQTALERGSITIDRDGFVVGTRQYLQEHQQ